MSPAAVHIWMELTKEIELGPPKPHRCVDGPQSHRWLLVVEEGRVGLSCPDCRLCHDGIVESELMDDIELDEIPVTVAIESAGVGDSTYVYLRATAVLA